MNKERNAIVEPSLNFSDGPLSECAISFTPELNVPLAKDSRWFDREDFDSPDSVKVSKIIIKKRGKKLLQISAEHNGPWHIYTDTGFEEWISKLLNREVSWSEQGLQMWEVADLETFV